MIFSDIVTIFLLSITGVIALFIVLWLFSELNEYIDNTRKAGIEWKRSEEQSKPSKKTKNSRK